MSSWISRFRRSRLVHVLSPETKLVGAKRHFGRSVDVGETRRPSVETRFSGPEKANQVGQRRKGQNHARTKRQASSEVGRENRRRRNESEKFAFRSGHKNGETEGCQTGRDEEEVHSESSVL